MAQSVSVSVATGNRLEDRVIGIRVPIRSKIFTSRNGVHSKVKVIPVQAMETLRVARG
jgi:hypothetical protein